QPGGLYLTGHDPDDHAVGDAANRSINNTAVRYVTSSMPKPAILLVTDVRNPGGDQADSRVGLTNSGLTYDVADYGSGTAGVLDLHKVDFANYDAIYTASDYGGWMRQDEVDVLSARRSDFQAAI